MVAVGTFDWHSVRPRTLRRMPKSETAVMLATVGMTVTTHNLAYGVGVGVLVAMVLFARRVAHLVEVSDVLDPDATTKIYRVSGQLFFASSNDLVFQFDYAGDPDHVVIDLSAANVWDGLDRRSPGRHHHEVCGPRQDRDDHRHERAEQRPARGPDRQIREHPGRRARRPSRWLATSTTSFEGAERDRAVGGCPLPLWAHVGSEDPRSRDRMDLHRNRRGPARRRNNWGARHDR
jgi:MFS superfamily sulfate permease-like transporter